MNILPTFLSSFRSIFPSLARRANSFPNRGEMAKPERGWEGWRGAVGSRVGVRLFLLLLPVLPLSAQEGFVHKRYAVDMTVHADNSFSVREQMDVEFSEPRHGIVRDWPGSVYVKRLVPVSDKESAEKVMCYNVTLDNVQASEESSLEEQEGFYVLKLGSADRTVFGPHTYTISYDYKVGNDRVNTSDVFYYSLLGDDNGAPVDEFRFSVRFDKPLPPQCLDTLHLYVGPLGLVYDKADTNIDTLTATFVSGVVRDIAPGTAVTMFVGLPEGYFSQVPPYEDKTSALWWILTAASAILMGFVLIRESRVRNNYVKVVECWPPEGLSSADLGYIYDTTVDPRDIISLIPYFAHKGLLTIETTDGHAVLHKRADIPADAPAYQKRLFDGFFAKGPDFDTQNPPANFAEAWLAMDNDIKAANKGMPDRFSGHILTGAVACVLLLVALAAGDPTGTQSVLAYFFGIVACMAGVMLLSLFFWDKSKGSLFGRAFLVLCQGGLFYAQYSLVCGAATDVEVLVRPAEQYMLGFVWLLFAFASFFAYRLRSMSPERLKHIGYILGFKEFIEKSERDFLATLLKEHEQYFYDILPYAVAFDLLDHWAAQFKDLIVTPPDWYQGDANMGTFIGTMHANSLYTDSRSNQVAKLYQERAAASRSASRSSSIGGFSGGGFGGGGCHSW